MHTKLFNELLACIDEALAIRDGDQPACREHALPVPNVKTARDRLRLTQADFAKLLGVRIKTLQMWEKGRRRPHGPILALCRIILTHPEQALAGLRNASVGEMPSTAPSAIKHREILQEQSVTR
jgi:putative transcriptional regulator